MLEVDVKKRINAWELASGTKYLGNVHQELPKLKREPDFLFFRSSSLTYL